MYLVNKKFLCPCRHFLSALYLEFGILMGGGRED